VTSSVTLSQATDGQLQPSRHRSEAAADFRVLVLIQKLGTEPGSHPVHFHPVEWQQRVKVSGLWAWVHGLSGVRSSLASKASDDPGHWLASAPSIGSGAIVNRP
jgi:hypothetical protein